MANMFITDSIESNYLNFIVEPYLNNINEYASSVFGPDCDELSRTCDADYAINFNS